MKRTILIILTALCFFQIGAPEVQAIDPVTIAILAPIALKAAETMRPYIQRGLIQGTKGLIETGKDTLEILYLPWGVIQATLGWPFGAFGPGVGNMGRGIAAPFKVVGDVLLLPIQFMGINTSM